MEPLEKIENRRVILRRDADAVVAQNEVVVIPFIVSVVPAGVIDVGVLFLYVALKSAVDSRQWPVVGSPALKPFNALADLAPMGPMQLVVSGILTLIVYSMVLFAVYKVFQISNDVGEVKELLRAIKRNTEAAACTTPDLKPAPVIMPGVSVPQSAEALVRAVHEGWKAAPEQ